MDEPKRKWFRTGPRRGTLVCGGGKWGFLPEMEKNTDRFQFLTFSEFIRGVPDSDPYLKKYLVKRA